MTFTLGLDFAADIYETKTIEQISTWFEHLLKIPCFGVTHFSGFVYLCAHAANHFGNGPNILDARHFLRILNGVSPHEFFTQTHTLSDVVSPIAKDKVLWNAAFFHLVTRYQSRLEAIIFADKSEEEVFDDIKQSWNTPAVLLH